MAGRSPYAMCRSNWLKGEEVECKTRMRIYELSPQLGEQADRLVEEGKTTFVQGVVSALGSEAAVVSPTYTLVEEYVTACGCVHHLDLYRIQNSDEVEGLALRDRCDNDSILLIEWPERGIGALPFPSWEVSMRYRDPGRTVCITRR